jgi:pimeloyl-ACP methyl ester carboxylesterase
MPTFDPITQDPPYDANFPPRYISVQIPCAGENMLGVMYTAQGSGAHPTAVLLHGFPGNERNFDLAHILRRAGWNVLIFHYRGAWGSPGTFSFTHVLEDTHAALNFVRNMPNIVDTTGIVLMGHSMGAWASLMCGAADLDLWGVAAFGTWNITAFAETMPKDENAAILEWLAGGCAPLRPGTPQALLDDINANAVRFDLRNLDFTNRRVLLVAGADDEDTPDIIHHNPLVRAYASAKLTHKTIENADHGFSGQRLELARTVLDWLDSLDSE